MVVKSVKQMHLNSLLDQEMDPVRREGGPSLPHAALLSSDGQHLLQGQGSRGGETTPGPRQQQSRPELARKHSSSLNAETQNIQCSYSICKCSTLKTQNNTVRCSVVNSLQQTAVPQERYRKKGTNVMEQRTHPSGINAALLSSRPGLMMQHIQSCHHPKIRPHKVDY